jgi:hypothetical protein
MSETIPNPGTDLARRAGCRCDMIRNGYGRGAYVSGGGEVQYDVNPKCPLHGDRP